ncbi:Heavy metal RND efflux outer membrane protein, CzcC family [hydrothermal vent metagenome]|uniref:Heavy metal RND efflux outer membrane protein, CzcC family n=1 Tax=hydrothermal vent metagenome TaxID=652676 RepID=A0A3B1DYN1_9ZZZZ
MMFIRLTSLAIVLMFVTGCATSSVRKFLSKTGVIKERQSSPEKLAKTHRNNTDKSTDETESNPIQQVAAEELETNPVEGTPIEGEGETRLVGRHPVLFYIQIALERNPEILAAQHRVAAQNEVVPQVTALEDPTLTNTFQPFHNNRVQTAAGGGPNVSVLSQKFPWFGKLRVRGEVAEAETQIALSRLAQAQLKVVEDVNLAYYDVYFNQKAIKITEQDQRLLTDLLKFAEARYRTGKTSQQDVLRAQVEIDKLDNRLILLRQQLKQAQANLAEVIQEDPESDLQASNLEVPSAPKHIRQLYEAAILSRPEIQEQLHALTRSQKVEELAQLDYKPDVKLGLGWQAITRENALANGATGNDNFSISVGINLPIYRQRLDAGVNEAEHRIMETTRRYEATRDDTYRIIRRLTVQSNAIEEQIKLFRDKIIPKSEQTLRISTADYRVGKVDFQQIIDNWSDLLVWQVQLVRLETNLGQTLASLERVVGRELATFSKPVELTPPPAPVAPPVPAEE